MCACVYVCVCMHAFVYVCVHAVYACLHEISCLKEYYWYFGLALNCMYVCTCARCMYVRLKCMYVNRCPLSVRTNILVYVRTLWKLWSQMVNVAKRTNRRMSVSCAYARYMFARSQYCREHVFMHLKLGCVYVSYAACHVPAYLTLVREIVQM